MLSGDARQAQPIGGEALFKEGAYKGKEAQNLLASLGIELDLHPGQASWQNGITERTIQTLKTMASKLAR